MKFVYHVLFGLVVLSLGNLAQAGPTPGSEVAATLENEEEVGNHAISARTADQPSWDTWLISNAWTIASGTLGAIFLVGGIGIAFYYFYYINYYGYSGDPYAAYTNQQQQQYAVGQQYGGQYYAPNSRSFDSGNSSKWNISWSQVLYMISLAQESYEKFDYQSMDCQKKTLCELAQKQGDFGLTGTKISKTFSVMDAVEGLPMPDIIHDYLKEYREAINQGSNSPKDCSAIYSKCGFSIKDVLAKYQKRAAAGKF